MVVQTRGYEPPQREKTWEEKYAPWLIGGSLATLGVAGGLAILGHKPNISFSEGISRNVARLAANPSVGIFE